MTTVAIQGEPGCFSHVAARTVFGHDVDVVPCRDFDGLFAAVAEGRADRGAVPVENALAGAVVENLDLLLEHPLEVMHETYVRVELCLVVPPGNQVDSVRTAASHPVALRQCRTFFSEHPDIQPVAVYDTAGSIRDLMGSGAPYQAAIGPALAADLYGGNVVRRGIEDHHRNYTRFFVVARQGAEAEEPGPDRTKTSLAFTLSNRPGSLHHALGVFATRGVDLTRLESRPIVGHPWEYRFYVDIRTGSAAKRDDALDALREEAVALRVFGTYAEADPP